MQFVSACSGSQLCGVDLSLEDLTVENGCALVAYYCKYYSYIL